MLFDSGSQHTWLAARALPPGIIGKTVPTLRGRTMAGTFLSSQAVDIEGLSFPEFSTQRILETCQARIFHTTCRYDMIIGRDLLQQLGFQLDFSSNTIQWDDTSLPMRPLPPEPPSTEPNLANQLYLEAIDDTLQDSCPCGICDTYQQDGEISEPTPDDEHYDGLGYKSKTILSSKYTQTNTDHLVETECKHLSNDQQNDLKQLLRKYDKLFDGKLKKFNGNPIHLDLEPNAQPHRSATYTVPHTQRDIFQRELQRLVDIGVLEPCGRSEWIAGTFIIPKKDGKVRWITDFRGLNRVLKRKVYPLPKIADILARRKGYKFLTKLDISMQYYTFELDEESSDLCTIATPFGMYRYRRLPMGISQSPDIAQEMMERTLRDLQRDLEIYIDDIACFSNTWKDHITLLDRVLTRLQQAGFTINPAKCEWCVKETDFLGHWLTPNGIKPWKKKIDAILKLGQPTNIKQLRSFLGMVTYYRDMWPRRSHILAPLTDLTGTKTFEWTPTCTQAFKRMKAMMAMDTMLAYPDHNKPYHIETDASDYQLGAVIKQDGRPVAYYTRKLTPTQQNYTTIEKELLSVVETLREFRTMLLGATLHVYTDHRNLTHHLSSFTTRRVLRWRLLLEEYGPIFHYKTGETNLMADALSRLPTTRCSRDDMAHAYDPFLATSGSGGHETDPNDEDAFLTVLNDPELLECFSTLPDLSQLVLPELSDINWTWTKTKALEPAVAASAARISRVPTNTMQHPNAPPAGGPAGQQINRRPASPAGGHASQSLHDAQTNKNTDTYLIMPQFDAQGRQPFHFSTIETYQQNDPVIRQLVTADPNQFIQQQLGQSTVICRRHRHDFQIVLPDAMLTRLVRWYHEATMHVEGMDRLEQTIQRHYYHPHLRREIRDIVRSCPICQTMKRDKAPQYGENAPRDAPATPWQEIHVDCIGPWQMKVNGQLLKYMALTILDPVTNLMEIQLLPNKTAAATKRALELAWLCRYPRPSRCVHDNGTEFLGHDFQFGLAQAGIASRPVTSLNPHSNGVIERSHAAVAQVLRTMIQLRPPTTNQEARDLMEDSIAQAVHAVRCVAHGSLQNASPGAVAFHRDMFLDLPFIIDLLSLQQTRQQQIDLRLLKTNQRRRPHDWQVGEQVLVRNQIGPGDKLKPTYRGPFPIIRVHANGNVTIRQPNQVQERINIRRLKPFRT